MPADLKKVKNLVLSGGGSKGFSYFGMYKALLELDPQFSDQIETITGTSAGAIMATLIALKYTPDELYSFITSFDYEKLRSWDIMNMLKNQGLETGEKLLIFLQKLISKKLPEKPDPTFQDLYQFHPYTLNILASHLNTYSTKIYNHQSTPDFSVALAIRQSISIPVMFTPVKLPSTTPPPTPTPTPPPPPTPPDYYVDGGLINNFPIDLFPDSDETLGVILDNGKEKYEIQNNEQYIYHVMMCGYHQMTLHKLKHYKKTQILKIDTGNIHAAQFDIGFPARKKLYETGYQSTLNFFQPTSVDHDSAPGPGSGSGGPDESS